jgi:hypothetical protein
MIDEGLIGKSAGKIFYSDLDPGERSLLSMGEGAEIMWESERRA